MAATTIIYRFPHDTWETTISSGVNSGSSGTGNDLKKFTSLNSENSGSSSSGSGYSSNSRNQSTVRLSERCRRLVKATRQDRQYTQRTLASKLYVSVLDIKALERGDRPVQKHIADLVLFSLNIRLASSCFY